MFFFSSYSSCPSSSGIISCCTPSKRDSEVYYNRTFLHLWKVRWASRPTRLCIQLFLSDLSQYFIVNPPATFHLRTLLRRPDGFTIKSNSFFYISNIAGYWDLTLIFLSLSPLSAIFFFSSYSSCPSSSDTILAGLRAKAIAKCIIIVHFLHLWKVRWASQPTRLCIQLFFRPFPNYL